MPIPLFPTVRRAVPLAAGLLLAGVALAGPPAPRDGDLDPRFGQDGTAFLASSNPNDRLRPAVVLTQPDGKLLMAGSRDRFTPSSPFDPHVLGLVARVDAAGRPDASFGGDPAAPGLVVLPDLMPGTAQQEVEAMQRLADGSILLAGTAQAFGPLTGFVVKLDAAGAIDRSFGDAGVVRVGTARFHALEIDSRGRIVVAGELIGEGVVGRAIVARYTAQGVPDAGFGDGQGHVLLGTAQPERAGYLHALRILPGDAVLAAGSWAEVDFLGTEFWIHRLDAAGRPDPGFGDSGSRAFRLPGSDSTLNGIGHLLVEPDGRIVFAGHHETVDGTGLLFGRLIADGRTDASFGDGVHPGYQQVDIAPQAWNRYPSGLVRQSDGRLVASAYYATGWRSQFVALRLDADGVPDPTFGDGGVASFDLAPEGVFSDATALTLQAGQPVIAGAVMRSTERTVDLALIRLHNDRVFTGAFDQGPPGPETVTIGYDTLAEGFRGAVFAHAGVVHEDVNGVDGVYPDGVPFTAGELGSEVVVENAAMLFEDFPQIGSAPNLLTFGRTFIGGPNFTIGPLANLRLTLDAPATGVGVNLVHYENGPWGGIEVRLEAYRADALVGSASFTIDGSQPGRDNIAMRTLTLDGVEFDALRISSRLDGRYTAARVMLDDLRLTRAPVR
ncbi:MAG TPA: hypothetical protein VMR06_08480 [Dokdonella sp.]|uniref:hypothetical protein n=1 Tax=Dokdonella sp. TaxID=2291710 RepID=UPI002B7BD8EF|nr:hypothetical protein [Dokdonella sp.]HUD42017.1 hypothetical protein [Dokdonella sp.]